MVTINKTVIFDDVIDSIISDSLIIFLVITKDSYLPDSKKFLP